MPIRVSSHKGRMEIIAFVSSSILLAYLWRTDVVAQNSIGNINNNHGIITQGQIGNNNLIIGNQRLQYSDVLSAELVEKFSDKSKIVRIFSIGSASDQDVANKFQAFLEQNSFKVARMTVGQMAPPPDHKLTYRETPQAYLLYIAPSAVE